MLRVLAGIDAPDGGSVEVDGTDVASLRGAALRRYRREQVAYLAQRAAANLVPHLTVAEQLGAGADAVAVALEAAAIVLLATIAGGVIAAVTARPIVAHVDALPLYAPAPVYVAPWTTLVAAAAAAVAVSACLGALATAIAGRSNVAEALRVA